MVYARARKLEVCSALEAETKGFKDGLLYCLSHNLFPLTMESDSLTIKKILDGTWEVPWVISTDIREIREEIIDKEVMVVHSFREGNKLANFLTNIIINLAGAYSIQFNHTNKLPIHGKLYYSWINKDTKYKNKIGTK